MKIAETHEGQRVTWRGRGGEVLYVQPEGVAPDLAAEDAVVVAVSDSREPHPYIITPRGVWTGGIRHKRSVLVRLDHDAVVTGRCTRLSDPRYLWTTPSALYPEAAA